MNRPDDKFCGGCAKALRAIPSIAAPKPAYNGTVPIDIRDVISETPAD